MKINKKYLIISIVLILIPVFVGLVLWNKLPDQIATHFGVDNMPDGYSSKTFTVLGIPLIMVALQLFGILVTYSDPKASNIGNRAMNYVYWIIPFVINLVSVLSYTYALNNEIRIGMIIMIALGMMFIVLGNIMPTTKRNYTFGAKLPWTLNDDNNWRKTNRLQGWCMVILGVVFIITAPLESYWTLLAVVPAIAVPTVYSYLYYNKHK